MIYLNNAATSFPKPSRVVEAVRTTLERPPYHHARAGFESGACDVLADCRRLLCQLFHAEDHRRMVFTSGATESLNLAIRGLQLEGKHVVTTAIEHNSVLRPLKTLERDSGLGLTIVDCDEFGFVAPENIAKAMRGDTAAVIVNHCSNVTGVVNEIGAIGDITRRRGVSFIVDASQSAGVWPIDVRAMNIDILVFTGHKSLYGMQGIGGAYIGENIRLRPLIVGGTGVRSDDLFQPEDMPMYLEAGTQNLPGIASLCQGVQFVLEKGIDVLREQKQRAVEEMRSHLSRKKGVALYPNGRCDQKTTLFSFNVSGMSPEDVGYILEHSFDIIVRSGLHCAPLIHRHIGTFPDGSVRVSPSCFTTDDDIDVFDLAINEICAMG